MPSQTPNDSARKIVYQDDRYYQAFKRVRNRIRKFDSLEVIMASIEKLRETNDSDIDPACPFWFLFLLIKWAALYGDPSPAIPKRLTIDEFHKIIDLIHDVHRGQYGNLFLLHVCLTTCCGCAVSVTALADVVKRAGGRCLMARCRRAPRQTALCDGEPSNTKLDVKGRDAKPNTERFSQKNCVPR